MDIIRAKQIVSSPKDIDVLYHGVPIWIKNCNDNNESCSIYDLDNPDDVRIVPVNELEEK
jgi:small acid-soluble spore protein H (minor)